MKKILYTTSLVFLPSSFKRWIYGGNIMLYRISVAERGLTGIANIFRSPLSRLDDLLRAGTAPLTQKNLTREELQLFLKIHYRYHPGTTIMQINTSIYNRPWLITCKFTRIYIIYNNKLNLQLPAHYRQPRVIHLSLTTGAAVMENTGMPAARQWNLTSLNTTIASFGKQGCYGEW